MDGLRKYLRYGILLVILLAFGYGYWWLRPQPVMDEARLALQSDEQVRVVENRFLKFQPAQAPKSTGLILYPGGLVPAAAYAPLARQLAELGYPVWLVPMPLNLAILGSGRAEEIMAAHPQVKQWVLAGHSLGGAMAARYAFDHPGTLAGLVLLAGYPAASQPLTYSSLPVLSVYASEDGLATPAKIMEYASRLPEHTIFVELAGGNHAQFGWYGPQAGDGAATITREKQQQNLLAVLQVFLNSL